MYARAGAAVGVCGHEQGCTSGWFENLPFPSVQDGWSTRCPSRLISETAFETYLWSAEVLFGLIVHNKDVGGLHELLLDTRRREEDMVIFLDGDAAAGACDPAVTIELVAEGGNMVCGMQWVVGGDERIFG